ncbi:ATP-binding protein [Arenicella xantha]|uniref:histidine kinase n=1 Tax=Arenicella xantha TaxID=644221 RepID=A0A395JPC5_9GAMM|nr:ATP-binding protein [Arenicella xantha]RBP51424.1 signal transduction histidine kinase [Arenicella xantha]
MDDLQQKLELARARSARHKQAKNEAESLLEKKSRELYEANQELERAQKRLEDEVKQAVYELSVTNKRLQSALSERSTFIGQMSHEVRTPLNAIIGLSEILLDSKLDEAQSDYIDTINNGAKSLVVLLDDMLDITKIEAGRVEINPQPEDPHKLHKNIVSMFALDAKKRGLKLELRIDNTVPALVRVDKGRYKQIINNLIANALKNTKKGRVFVDVAYDASPVAPDMGSMIVKVVDTGIGIPEDQLKRIFNAYEQIGNVDQGVGLGLAICQQLSELMMGRIRCTSKLGRGSIFELSLPVEVLQAPVNEVVDTPVSSLGSLPTMKILVAEDNPTNQKVITAQLAQLGQRADVVNNGAEAIAKLREQEYDVVILDILMPVMDGEEAIRTIRSARREISQHYCIALTASNFQDQRERLLKLGFDKFLSKPLSLVELSKALHDVPQGLWVTSDMQAITDLTPDQSSQDEVQQVSFDYSYLKTQFGDAYKTIFREVAPSFLDHAFKEFEVLKQSIVEGNTEQIRSTSHSMKGAASSIGLNLLANMLMKIESEPAAADITQKLDRVEQMMTQVKPVIEREISGGEA